MQNIRWVNQSHPQTLNIGVILLYFDAVFMVIGGRIASGLGFLLAAASVLAGVGIANDKRSAWYLGVAVSAILPAILLYVVWSDGVSTLFNVSFMINAVFPIAQFAALIHPISRNYVKTWFE